MTGYVVAKNIRQANLGGDTVKQYLVAIDYNPYQTIGRVSETLFVYDRSEAFQFQDRGAAEVAAVFVGGFVEPPKVMR